MRCSRCHEVKDAANFYKSSHECKLCENERKRIYRQTHKAEVSARHAKYYRENKEKVLATNTRWRMANKERHASLSAAWIKAHPKEYAQRRARYYAENKEAIAAVNKAWAQQHRDECRAMGARRRALMHQASGVNYTTKEHIAARWEMWGGQCWICGAPATAIDHVKPLTAGGGHWPCNLRPICEHCNPSKGNKWPYEGFRN